MFVPCDEDGDVLEEKSIFTTTDEDYIFNSDAFDNYQQAKERCLFKGFTSINFVNSARKGNYIIDFNYTENSNIESLLRHDIEFELTPTALKQIGL